MITYKCCLKQIIKAILSLFWVINNDDLDGRDDMKQSLSRVKQPKKFDFILTGIIVCMMISSIIAIYSSIPQMPSYLDPSGTLTKQIMFYLLGFIIVGIIMYVGNDSIYEFAVIGYKIIIGMLIYLFISSLLFRFTGRQLWFVNRVNGATSWFLFPIIGSFQPSEFMKIILIVIVAHIIQVHNENKVDDSFESDIELFLEVGKWAFTPMILILLQPDTGICIIIAFSLLLMLACGGIRREWMIWGISIIIIALTIFLTIYFTNQDLFKSLFGDSYKMKRIYGWLEVEKYSNGVGIQLYKALLAIGSSGWFGHGVQSMLISIPEPHTDFIFAVIGLCFGFIGCIIVILLCISLDVRLAQISIRTTNLMEKLIVTGFLGMLIFQQIQNIGMVIGLLPITGITLPMISYGGSSLLSYMTAFGIIMNTSLRAKKLSDYVYE